jgi:hypothetical protein
VIRGRQVHGIGLAYRQEIWAGARALVGYSDGHDSISGLCLGELPSQELLKDLLGGLWSGQGVRTRRGGQGVRTKGTDEAEKGTVGLD